MPTQREFILLPKLQAIYSPALFGISGIMLDPEIFPDGDKFIPERFLETTDPRLLNYKFGSFGFGRRICPGMHVAIQSVYIIISR